ncbi:MFS transporter [Pseudomonas alcaligenes]|uniref:MFS transporter n=1 Tax=Aquipseudomonas alcaligenes TaxID=43263 RepID=A0ABR7RX28_AQUAC|nr:alpha/beta hydrolase [Pseudomonas alcaligenes]MBC9249890.1 MFS transporter [Pseudomonas alcaligenes]
MKAETAVLDIQGQYRVYTEFYRADSAEQTIILVNGSLSTTASFAQTVRYLHPHFNVVLFDLPYAGQSREHNQHTRFMSREEEADILLELVEHFACDIVLSFSWGGIATLQALARKPRRIKRAVINSFSPIVNSAMLGYLRSGLIVMREYDRESIGMVLNGTIGKHLPSLFKRYNHRHVTGLERYEYDQMSFHVENVLNNGGRSCISFAGQIEIPLLFVNGEWDEYTTAQDARMFTQHVQHCEFRTIGQAGHFLDMEHKAAWLQTRDALLAFLLPPLGSRQRQAAVLEDSALVG